MTPASRQNPQYGPVRRAVTRVTGWVRKVSFLGAGVLLTAAALRATVRDAWAPAAPFFYALPLPVQVMGWTLLALVWRRRRSLRIGGLAMAVICLTWWTLVAWRPLEVFKHRTGDRAVSVLFWNIGHTGQLPETLRALIRERQPEFVALVESEELSAAAMSELSSAVPGYQVLQMSDGMVAMVKGTARTLSSRWLKQESRIHVVSAELTSLPGEMWRFVLCDVGPWPPLPRTDVLDDQFKEAGSQPRTIVVGDFNTPIDSAGFDAWHRRFQHGIADCMDYDGPPETWCFGLPVLAIDHQWGSRDLVPAQAEKGSQFLMDHQWLLVRWLVVDPAEVAGN